jgi:hypothetical protein
VGFVEILPQGLWVTGCVVLLGYFRGYQVLGVVGVTEGFYWTGTHEGNPSPGYNRGSSLSVVVSPPLVVCMYVVCVLRVLSYYHGMLCVVCMSSEYDGGVVWQRLLTVHNLCKRFVCVLFYCVMNKVMCFMIGR